MMGRGGDRGPGQGSKRLAWVQDEVSMEWSGYRIKSVWDELGTGSSMRLSG